MITILYHQFLTPFEEGKWDLYFQQMPADIQARIRRYRKEENKYQLLIGRLLLKEGMNRLGFNSFQLANLYYDEYNCPRWKDGINFNIAHSGNVVACAFSERLQIGLDIEKIRFIHLKDFDYILNDLDYQSLQNSDNPYRAFFKIWTIKEAVTKAIGKGLAIDVQQIRILEDYAILDEQKWFFQALSFAPNFAAHIVSNQAFHQNVQLTSFKDFW